MTQITQIAQMCISALTAPALSRRLKIYACTWALSATNPMNNLGVGHIEKPTTERTEEK